MLYEKRNVRVLPDDTDAFGRLNWLAYVRYCEEGEAGIFEQLGFSAMRFFREWKISFPRRAATFDYCSQVAPDNFIDIETSFKEKGKTSFTLQHLFYKKNTLDGERILAATAQVTVVAFDHQLHQKTQLPRELIEAIKRVELNEQKTMQTRCVP
jgi:YbgC/YbaW family acyl-CoA thioester hydrolase